MHIVEQKQKALREAKAAVIRAEEELYIAAKKALCEVEKTKIIESFISKSGKFWYLVKPLSKEEADSVGLFHGSLQKIEYLSDLDSLRIFTATSYEGFRIAPGYWTVGSGPCKGIESAIESAEEGALSRDERITYPSKFQICLPIR